MNIFKHLLAAALLCFSSLAFAAVDLNKATVAELEAVKNIGQAKAKAIVEYREKNNGFKKVEDLKNISGIGDKIYEQIKSEFVVNVAAEKASGKGFAGVVNINTADEKTLTSLPGVGDVKAKAIIDQRAKAPFKSVDDLANVKGFSKATVDKLRANLSVN